MGLFSRKNPYDSQALDLEGAMREAPVRPDSRSRQSPPPNQVQPTALSPQRQQAQPPAVNPPAQTTPAPKPTYGIEDAVRLMRELPDDKKEMIINIVQKTLISAKINIQSIIEDGARKIDRLEKKNEKLSMEIRELEEGIAQRKMEMDKNVLDVSETRQVKQSFESIQARGLDDTTHRPSVQSAMSSPTHEDLLTTPPLYVSTQKTG